MLAARDPLAVQVAGTTRVSSIDGEVVDWTCLPWKAEQLSLVQIYLQEDCRQLLRSALLPGCPDSGQYRVSVICTADVVRNAM